MSTNNNFGIAAQIKKKMGNRILECLLLLSLAIIGLTVFDTVRSFEELEKVINTECSFLSDFTISQVLINNQQAVDVKLADYNQNSSYNVSWITSGQPKDSLMMIWEPIFSWHYNYPIVLADGEQFGYFHVTGSILNDHELLSDLLGRIMLMALFAITFFALLYPLAKKIPKQLFVDPINDILKLLKTGSQQGTAINLPSEMLEIQNKITELLDEVSEKSKEAAFAELAAQVAHDIRSPLAALDMLVKHLSDVPENQRIILRNATTRINDIANNLLNEFRSRKQIPELASKRHQAVLVSTIIESMISEKRLQYENRKIEFTAQIDATAYFIFVNIEVDRLKRVLSNLINNSVEAIKAQGQVIVSLRTAGNEVKLAIVDNGRGIPREKLEHIFEAGSFNKKGGLGLGLSHAKQSIEEAKGKISISSELNQGTTVSISLPKAIEPAWFANKISLTLDTEVCIVDDDSSIHDAWNERFANFPSLNIYHFDSPINFVEWFKAHSNKKFFLLSDYEFINAPLNGLDIISKVNSKNCILVTSYFEDKNIIQKCEGLGIRLLPKNLSAYIPIEIK
ncbi:MAG: sensor histidine kinase [Gammaproteobacteria bacterium]|jgi:signal transduction histidine kinase|nr:sensor histidine kinase [Gammaproteobacteria bacterium]